VDDKVVDFEMTGTVIREHPETPIRPALDGVGLLIAAGRLVPILREWMPLPTDGFLLYYPSHRQNTAPLQALVDSLRANLKAGSPWDKSAGGRSRQTRSRRRDSGSTTQSGTRHPATGCRPPGGSSDFISQRAAG
jgi:hypothetical protein